MTSGGSNPHNGLCFLGGKVKTKKNLTHLSRTFKRTMKYCLRVFFFFVHKPLGLLILLIYRLPVRLSGIPCKPHPKELGDWKQVCPTLLQPQPMVLHSLVLCWAWWTVLVSRAHEYFNFCGRRISQTWRDERLLRCKVTLEQPGDRSQCD